MSWINSLNKTIGSLFDPVLNFSVQVWDYLSSFFAFLWDLIEGLYFGFNTIITKLWVVITDISGISFFSDNSSNIANLTSFLGISGMGIFMSIFLIAVFLVLLRFVFSLIPFFKK